MTGDMTQGQTPLMNMFFFLFLQLNVGVSLYIMMYVCMYVFHIHLLKVESFYVLIEK